MKKFLIIYILFVSTCLSAFGESFTIAGSKARIVLAKGEPEFVALAAGDLAADIRAVSGMELKIVNGGKARKGDIFISTNPNDNRWEAYEATVSDGKPMKQLFLMVSLR